MKSETSATLQIESILSMVCVGYCSFAMLYYIFFVIFTNIINPYNKCNSSHLLHTAGITSMFCSVASEGWFSFFGTNWLHVFVNINHLIPSQEQICDISFRLNGVFHTIQMYTFFIFLFGEFHYLLQYLPTKYHIKDTTYRATSWIFLCISFPICMFLFDKTYQIGIIETVDDSQYKYCCFNFNETSPESVSNFMFSFMVASAVAILCGAYNLFSQMESLELIYDNSVNKTEIKHFVYGVIYFIAVLVISNYLDLISNSTINSHISPLVMTTFMIWYQHKNYQLFINSSKTWKNNMQTTHVQHRIIQPHCRDANQLHVNRLKSMLAVEFLDDAKKIYSTLRNIYSHRYEISINDILLQIAIFGATKHVPCIDCGTHLPLMECESDYIMDFGVITVVDEYQTVKYYINENKTTILCRFCASKNGIVSNVMLFPMIESLFQKLGNTNM